MFPMGITKKWVGLAAWGGLAVFIAGGCRTVQNAAANDPQRCERDPTCAHRSDKSKDCATACADNIDCMDRCKQVTGQR